MIIATVKNLKGCHSYGRFLREAQANVLDALSLWAEKPVTADQITEDLSRIVSRLLVRRIEEARAIEEQARRLPAMRKQIAQALVDSGLSTRDAALLMGVAHQRVHQLASRRSSGMTRRARRHEALRVE